MVIIFPLNPHFVISLFSITILWIGKNFSLYMRIEITTVRSK